MPKSKHRRDGRSRPREHQMHAPERKPEPSPRWVPVTGTVLLVLGAAVVLAGYLPPVQDITIGWPPLGANWPLVAGFVLIVSGFGFLTRWR